jgi:hypothetical protein
VNFTGLLQVVVNLQQACWNQACCKLTFAELMQVDETTCIKSANVNLQQAWQNNLQQVWWTHQCWCKLRKSGLLQVVIFKLDASCFINLHQICGYQVLTSLIEQLAASLMNACWWWQCWCKLRKSGLLKVVQAICSKLVDNKSDKTTCSNSVKIRLVATWHFQTYCKL